ncbi:MAG: CaiB/BaiF CoA-transferase family protein [Pseudomonadota bacterium]|jgi:crotonobetainyl-CoA:carnitine CoA-transferase CaiB-like acyl-CoA transferase|nr:CaiB/BaiF CoA-transferase family protein [Pseudomonadota bacterium]
MGPLAGVKVMEIAGVGPAPMCAMLLADLGATVLRIERTAPVELGLERPPELNLLNRGRQVVALDLKSKAGVEVALALAERADVLIEGFRPGVMERLGLGPDACFERNQRLVYGRMTGWGQDGPLADAAAHDLNYIAITGALDAIGRKGQPPSIPLNLVGDFGGGALYLALGVLAALSETSRSGLGQVVDAAIVDGTFSLMTMVYGNLAAGIWRPERGSNVTDSGAPFYNVYECADGKYVSIAAVELRFFRELLDRMGIDEGMIPDRLDRSAWQETQGVLAERFRTRTRSDWCAVLEGTDSCFAPVLSMTEAASHPHVKARESLIKIAGVTQPAPAPRFSRTVPDQPTPPRNVSRPEALGWLRHWVGDARFAGLEESGAIAAVSGTEGNTRH